MRYKIGDIRKSGIGKKLYIKKFCEISGFVVWIINGKYVRDNIDEEFTNYGQHFRFKFIPKSEFWIDHEHSEGEERFFIDHLLVENRLMAEGKSYHEAIMKADMIERKERNNSVFFRKIREKRVHRKNIIEQVHKKLLNKYSTKNVKVWIVNGEIVRDLFFIDFTEGGHGFVYHFIPKNEIWLDDDLSSSERKFVLLHELHERNLMVRGIPYGPGFMTKKWERAKDYSSAHKSASEVEYYCRNHPVKLNDKLKEEIDIINRNKDSRR